ncbi:hypothetical protein [Agrobacterium sp. YIC 4121]|uniref:hypothetical protein n=1 Tax=Agrobacterium sp. YIC 4121 TaxID=1923829 RepID=UPI001301F060|nr:hypothetical protein [Agrobacterium sp. YIC 4121]
MTNEPPFIAEIYVDPKAEAAAVVLGWRKILLWLLTLGFVTIVEVVEFVKVTEPVLSN